MDSKFSASSLKYFYCDLEIKNSALVLFYMIISFGLYSVSWIYRKNKKFEEIDEDAPNAKRCAFVLFFLPVIWYGFVFIISKIIFQEITMEFITIKILGWSLISFLSLKYMYEFTSSFGKIVSTSGLLFYLLMYSGYLGVILFFFGLQIGLGLVLIPIFTIPAMQEMLNAKAFHYQNKEKSKEFNYMQRTTKFQ